MTIIRRVSILLSSLVALAAFITAPSTLLAQDEGPARVSVRIVDTKVGHQDDFAAAIREISQAAEEAGLPYFHVYQRVRGDNLPSFAIFQPDGAYGGVPQADIPDGVINRLQNANNGSTLLSMAFSGGISSGSVEPSAEFMRVRVRTARPGSADDYADWQANQLMPLLREAGVPDVRLGRVVLGGNPNTFVRLSY